MHGVLFKLIPLKLSQPFRQYFLLNLHGRRLLLILGDDDGVVGEFVLFIGVDMGVKNCQRVNESNIGRNLTQTIYFLLIRHPIFKHILPLTFQLTKQVHHELIQILYLQLRLRAQLLDIVLDDVLRVHVELVYLGPGEQVRKVGLFFSEIEVILGWILGR